MEYTFTLKYQLSEQDCDLGELVERLGAAGCEDALVGTGLPGRVALEFTREAASATAALTSALKDVKKAIPLATLIEASPDFVGLTDVAQVLRVSRQNMRKLMLTHTASFPPPIHAGSAAVWHLADILSWLQARAYALEQSLMDVATTTMQINLARQLRQIDPAMHRELSDLVA